MEAKGAKVSACTKFGWKRRNDLIGSDGRHQPIRGRPLSVRPAQAVAYKGAHIFGSVSVLSVVDRSSTQPDENEHRRKYNPDTPPPPSPLRSSRPSSLQTTLLQGPFTRLRALGWHCLPRLSRGGHWLLSSEHPRFLYYVFDDEQTQDSPASGESCSRSIVSQGSSWPTLET